MVKVFFSEMHSIFPRRNISTLSLRGISLKNASLVYLPTKIGSTTYKFSSLPQRFSPIDPPFSSRQFQLNQIKKQNWFKLTPPLLQMTTSFSKSFSTQSAPSSRKKVANDENKKEILVYERSNLLFAVWILVQILLAVGFSGLCWVLDKPKEKKRQTSGELHSSAVCWYFDWICHSLSTKSDFAIDFDSRNENGSNEDREGIWFYLKKT